MNHLRASALTVDEFDRKETRAPDKRSPRPGQWRLYNR
jgi:hypothetical protein